MDEALLLLTHGSMPLPDVAEHLGYTEPNSFWHAVKACWGATPRELRSNANDAASISTISMNPTKGPRPRRPCERPADAARAQLRSGCRRRLPQLDMSDRYFHETGPM